MHHSLIVMDSSYLWWAQPLAVIISGKAWLVRAMPVGVEFTMTLNGGEAYARDSPSQEVDGMPIFMKCKEGRMSPFPICWKGRP